jgi:hypothetical protein
MNFKLIKEQLIIPLALCAGKANVYALTHFTIRHCSRQLKCNECFKVVGTDAKFNLLINEWGRRGTLIDYWFESQRERDH